MADFEKLMAKAFKLAEKGLGYTSPNPPVGAILVKDGQIIAAGYHRRAGLPHAEVEALQEIGDSARGAKLVVTLEPCSHFGKTPPCVDAVIKAGIVSVVSAISDPNPVVSGNGFKRLEEAGIEVITGVLQNYAREFYRPYFKFITTGIPFVTLKYAQTIDGRVATRTGHSQWISSPESLVQSHKLRAINDAILIGNGTLRKDNPQLTTRLVKGRNPVRIILSKSGRIPLRRKVFTDGQSPTFIATSAGMLRNQKKQYQVIRVTKGGNGINLNDLLLKVGKMGMMTLLVEGGSRVLTSFLRQRLADKIIVCVAPMIIGEGIEAIGDLGVKRLDNSVRLKSVRIRKSGPDFIISGYPEWN
jgi:diaminohydroxyphosphoribosylaminopyrimidine deaminase/5-amino-6-(5-phosphoribosylamino)uracil reductase